jgi:hypothetical protein
MVGALVEAPRKEAGHSMRQAATKAQYADHPKTEPWNRAAVYGEQFWLKVDEGTARCVAAGLVTARLQVQAAQMVSFMTRTDSEPV